MYKKEDDLWVRLQFLSIIGEVQLTADCFIPSKRAGKDD